jgi:hypothetical protein
MIKSSFSTESIEHSYETTEWSSQDLKYESKLYLDGTQSLRIVLRVVRMGVLYFLRGVVVEQVTIQLEPPIR